MRRMIHLMKLNMLHFIGWPWLFALLLFALLGLFNAFYFPGKFSIYDSLILQFGAHGSVGNNSLLLLHHLLPYLLLMYFMDLYIENNVAKNLLYTMLRVAKTKYWLFSHLIVIFGYNAVYFLLYDLSAWWIQQRFYQGSEITLSFVREVLHDPPYPWWEFLLFVWGIQVLGSFVMSVVQMWIYVRTRKIGYGYVALLVVYLVNLLIPQYNFWLGSHIALGKYHVLSASSGMNSISSFVVTQSFMAMVVMYVLYRTVSRNRCM